MCGIVGLFLKDKNLEPELGALTAEMLVKMSDRGPDSAGLALYSRDKKFNRKITLKVVCSKERKLLYEALNEKKKSDYRIETRANHITIFFSSSKYHLIMNIINSRAIQFQVMSEGEQIEIFKEACPPSDFVKLCDMEHFAGTHAVGHTRMATESAVTTLGAHPFSTADDQCLVHNGSLSNHNTIRRRLQSEGQKFETDNDSEVAAAYLSWKMMNGFDLRGALSAALLELDGFFTFLVGTNRGFGVLRDRIACKPAILAETDQYVAFGSEYRALTNLPSIDVAKVWEPEPTRVYFWEL